MQPRILPPPVLVASNPQDTVITGTSDAPIVIQMAVSATNLSKTLKEYMSEADGMASDDKQGQCFYLEGGKSYFLRENLTVNRGFTLKTNPEDIAAGKGRAMVFLGGVYSENNTPKTFNFMLGAQPLFDGDNHTNTIEDIVFEDIDFDCPLAQRYSSIGYSATANYFSNQWSNHIPLTIKNLVWRNCSFQGIIRGFVRMQGSSTSTIDNILMEGCEIYNCGPFDNNGKGYNYFHMDTFDVETNYMRNFVIRNNTFFDSPKGALITTGDRNLDWADPTFKFNITIENNTFVNFCTRSSRCAFLSIRYMPNGSTITIKSNLFLLTKSAGDQRPLNFVGADVRTLQGACTDKTTFDIGNNWSTNDNLTDGQVFTSNAFSSTSKSFGKFAQYATVEYPQGTEELKVHVANISATDLMYQPNPPHPITDATVTEENAHMTDALDGTGTASVNLYFKDFDNDIVRNDVGASKWRVKQDTGIKTTEGKKTRNTAMYNLAGQRICEPQKGVYIKDGRKYVK